MASIKKTTVRFPIELDNELTDYAKRKEISKNQVVKKAIKELLNPKRRSR